MHLLVRVILVVTHLINLIVSKATAPTSAGVKVQLAIVNINAVLVLLLILGVPSITPAPAPQLINTLAQVPVIQVVQVLPVMANIKNAPANQAMNGRMAPVPKLVIAPTYILVPILMKPEGLEIPVIINTNHAPANMVTSGTKEYA